MIRVEDLNVDSSYEFYECLYCEDTGDVILREDRVVSFDIDEITEYGRYELYFTYSSNILLCKLADISYKILIGSDEYEKYYCLHKPDVPPSFTVFNVIHGKREIGVFNSLNKAKSYILFRVFLEGGVGRFPNIVSSNGGNVLYEDFKGEILYISEEVIR